nr:RusA family crossover junction endodeoxyribonuclease [uncultured Pseudomonas sp.]
MIDAFYKVLGRLTHGATCKTVGVKDEFRMVRADDLRELLRDWKRLDEIVRSRAPDLIPPRTIDLLDQMAVVVLEGDPRGKGRPKFAARGSFVQVYTDSETLAYEQLIQEEVLRLIGGEVLVHNTKQIKRRTFIEAYADMGGKPMFTGPVRVEMEIRHPIRASWTKAKTAGALNGEIAATIKPDIDNVLKIWCDAFNGCIWKDDTQVIRCTVDKMFAEEPSVLVRVIPLDLINA